MYGICIVANNQSIREAIFRLLVVHCPLQPWMASGTDDDEIGFPAWFVLWTGGKDEGRRYHREVWNGMNASWCDGIRGWRIRFQTDPSVGTTLLLIILVSTVNGIAILHLQRSTWGSIDRSFEQWSSPSKRLRHRRRFGRRWRWRSIVYTDGLLLWHDQTGIEQDGWYFGFLANQRRNDTVTGSIEIQHCNRIVLVVRRYGGGGRVASISKGDSTSTSTSTIGTTSVSFYDRQ